MPQGRRKIPFSGKAKRTQLQKKHEKVEAKRKNASREREDEGEGDILVSEADAGSTKDIMNSILDVKFTADPKNQGRHRYELKFKSETKAEVAAMRAKARNTISEEKKSLVLDVDEVFPPSLDFPQRPPWNDKMSKFALESNEENYFREYVEKIVEKHSNKLSYFELNLETWRQLWRVIEMSDVLLLVVDARYASAMCPPSLFKYISEKSKDMILVLNKVDLIPPALALAWKDYFEKKFPGIHVTFFTSCPSYNLHPGITSSTTGLKFRKLRGRISMVTEGARMVLEACRKIVAGTNVDLESWREKIENSGRECKEEEEEEEEAEEEREEGEAEEDAGGDRSERKRFENDILTIGMIGQPNAGKSSLINSLMGQRVVSVSKTPGHTKHFQTIFITKSVRLCDCPGLVFPSLVPKQLQILMGSYPIPQVREPYSTIMYLGERVDLPWTLALKHPAGPDETSWSAYDICEAWALKRGYNTAKSNRPDIYRAANHIMRMTLEGKITLSLFPPGFLEAKEEWEKKEEGLTKIQKLLGLDPDDSQIQKTQFDNEISEDEEENDKDDDSGSEEEADDELNKPKVANTFSALSALMSEDSD